VEGRSFYSRVPRGPKGIHSEDEVEYVSTGSGGEAASEPVATARNPFGVEGHATRNPFGVEGAGSHTLSFLRVPLSAFATFANLFFIRCVVLANPTPAPPRQTVLGEGF